MSEWETVSIAQLGRVVTGKTPPTASAEYFGGDELFVSPRDLSRNSYYVAETETRITSKALEKFKNQVIPRNSIIFTSLSFAFGKMGIAQRSLLTNQQINSVIVNSDNNYKFVFYLLKVYEDIIFSYNSGIDTPIVPKSVFEKIKVRIPQKKIQVKIAGILSAYDDLIENNRRRIALLERMAEQLYREWFVRFRFPGDKKKVKFINGLPQGWRTVPLAKAFQFTGGATPAKDIARNWTDGTINWFTPTDITAADGIFLEQSGMQCTDEGLANCSAKLFPPYSVMMTSRATIGAIGINILPACTNQGFIACIPNERYPLGYLYHWLKLSKSHFLSLSGGATFPELTKGTFKRIEILTPPAHLMDEFERRIAPMFKAVETLQKAIVSMTKTRDLLLPRLISGKLRVDKLDIQFPPSMQAESA